MITIEQLAELVYEINRIRNQQLGDYNMPKWCEISVENIKKYCDDVKIYLDKDKQKQMMLSIDSRTIDKEAHLKFNLISGMCAYMSAHVQEIVNVQ
jgi:hypothetical protein